MFRFKQFSIEHNDVGMKIGTDGVLLGAWTDCDQASSILDVGTGSGLLALMMAQKNQEAEITGIDIHPLAFEHASSNFQNSPWNHRLTCVQGDFLKHKFEKSYDLIVSNPPFFENGMAIQSEARMMARDAAYLPADLMIERMAALLSEEGKVSMIIPIDRGPVVLASTKESSLFLSRRTTVYPNETKAANRLLLELSKVEGVVEEGKMVVNEKSGGYSSQHKALTKDFYLNL